MCKGMIIGNTDGNIHGCPGDSLFPEHLSQYPFLKMHVKVLTRRVADEIKSVLAHFYTMYGYTEL